MALVALAGTLVALVVGGVRHAGGFALGAALAILGYLWLHQAVESLLANRPQRVAWHVVTRFALRYPLIFVVVYLFYRTGWLPLAAVLAGLFVPVAGACVEAFIQIREGWSASGAGDDAALSDK
jgi:hypothetical protein